MTFLHENADLNINWNMLKSSKSVENTEKIFICGKFEYNAYEKIETVKDLLRCVYISEGTIHYVLGVSYTVIDTGSTFHFPILGNCNHDKEDDFVAREIGLVDSLDEFGRSWLLEGEPASCGILKKEELLCTLLPPDVDPCLTLMDEDLFGKVRIPVLGLLLKNFQIFLKHLYLCHIFSQDKISHKCDFHRGCNAFHC